MKTVFALMTSLLIGSAAFAGDTCYQISTHEGAFSRTPELLCVSKAEGANGLEVTVTLKTGMPFSQRTIGAMKLDYLSGVKCIDCNKDVYGIANPSNSAFNALSVKFDGIRDIQTGAEEGVVYVGATKFFYRK